MLSTRKHPGDKGTTSILGRTGIPKNDLLLETLGSLDEASAALGVARSACILPVNNQIIQSLQNDLYRIMAEVGSSQGILPAEKKLNASRLEWLEKTVEETLKDVSMPRHFILPGDTPSSAALSMARAVVRRAERRVVELAGIGLITNPILLPYMNRLSTICFQLELSEIKAAARDVTVAE